ncbi:uncharacterized protein LOC111703731 [Eurytemora carolleeae]|uniref:uncharacterized protein LOC111703731 n=1 Tax=Eurytemora carolleeae TaxID=1294199 RepID=UPI000C78A501|nr:uncharacterized protein LOC111703731 [Eurytemora carolleeae]|eukprot:XP_023331535.1 uncharacterized protein LOC111703731 [Eurytemora affinis]
MDNQEKMENKDVNVKYTGFKSTLLIHKVGSGDQGRYMCRPSNSEPAPVMVYVAEDSSMNLKVKGGNAQLTDSATVPTSTWILEFMLIISHIYLCFIKLGKAKLFKVF